MHVDTHPGKQTSVYFEVYYNYLNLFRRVHKVPFVLLSISRVFTSKNMYMYVHSIYIFFRFHLNTCTLYMSILEMNTTKNPTHSITSYLHPNNFCRHLRYACINYNGVGVLFFQQLLHQQTCWGPGAMKPCVTMCRKCVFTSSSTTVIEFISPPHSRGAINILPVITGSREVGRGRSGIPQKNSLIKSSQ